MRNIAVSTARAIFNVFYRMARKAERENEVVFLSRQTDTPSFDYSQLAGEFARRGWTVHMHLKKVTKRNLASYAFHVLKEIRLLGRCKAAILDRYDPVVCLVDFECEPWDSNSAVNTDFPIKPVILQLWHAFGAYKKFGHQSVDTPEGHSRQFTDTFSIHHNYSWVVCSGKGARQGFAEAFACPPERVIAMDRPEYDELRALKEARGNAKRSTDQERKRVLMAPTLRISSDSAHPFRDLHGRRETLEQAIDADFVWSFHPLESDLPAPGNVSDQLLDCDILVTDYSSIAYEAYLLNIPVIFYIPDIESYLISPGLNNNPASAAPEVCATDEASLTHLLDAFVSKDEYPSKALDSFAQSAFEIDVERASTAAARLVDFIIEHCEP